MSYFRSARDAMARHGIYIALPEDGDLDDLERERFEGLREAVEPQERLKTALETIYNIAHGSRTINSLPHIKRIAMAAIYPDEAEAE